MRRWLGLLLLVVACGPKSEAEKTNDLDNCRRLTGLPVRYIGDRSAMNTCLVDRYGWTPGDAEIASLLYVERLYKMVDSMDAARATEARAKRRVRDSLAAIEADKRAAAEKETRRLECGKPGSMPRSG